MARRTVLTGLFVGALILAGAACRGENDVVVSDDTSPGPSPPSSPPSTSNATSTAASAPAAAETSVPSAVVGCGRILTLTDAADVMTTAPNGTDAVTLADAAEVVNGQPMWAPDGEFVAWAELSSSGGSLVTARADGADITRAPTGMAPFFIAWSPTGERLVHLGSPDDGTDNLELELVEMADPTSSAVLAAGGPFYSAWSPDGTQLVTHIESGLGLLDLTGVQAAFELEPAAFQTPAWLDAETVILAVTGEAQTDVVLAGTDGVVQQTLATFDGFVSFAPRPGTEEVALAVIGPDASAGSGPGLGVVGAAGEVDVVSEAPVVAYQWSPSGDRLLFGTVEQPASGAQVRWNTWDGERVTSHGAFLPSARLLGEYLPFWDQYSRSLTLWSPDGAAFVYAASDGIFVQDVTTSDPVHIGDGAFAAWSPVC